MNSVEFEVINFKEDKYPDGVVAVNMLLDGKKVNAFLDIAAIIAHSDIESQTPEAIRNNTQFGVKQYFALTCSCGVPGCAGFFDPIVQTLETINGVEFVKWSVAPNKSTFVEGDYLFPAQKYYATMTDLKNQLINLEQSGYYYEGFFEEYDKTRYTDLIQEVDRVYSVYNDFMLFSQLTFNYVGEEYRNKTVALTLDGVVQPIRMPIEDFLRPGLLRHLKDEAPDAMLCLIEKIKYSNVVFSALEVGSLDIVWEFVFENYFQGDFANETPDVLKKEYALAFGVYLKDESPVKVSLALI